MVLQKLAVVILVCAHVSDASSLRQVKDVSSSSGVLASVEDEGVAIAQTIQKTIKHVAEPVETGHEGEEEAGGSAGSRILFQLVFGFIYYFLIVAKYPELEKDQAPTEKAVELQQKDAFRASVGGETTFAILCLSYCCSAPRAAHTFHTTGVLTYWPSLILMTCFPCCTLFIMNSFTELNEKLGGEKAGVLQSCICAFCCSCCVIAQDAETLDLMTGARTGLIGVEVAS